MKLLMGERHRAKLAVSIAAQGLEPILLSDDPTLDSRLAGHADLMVCPADGCIVAAAHIVNILTIKGYKVFPAQKRRAAVYPGDAGLCLCLTERYAVYNPNSADPAALALLGERKRVPVAQGYSRCAVCIVNADSIITADAGVYKAAKNAGMDVLLVAPGYVTLEGFREGFLGGASFLISKNKLAFTGTLDAHPDKQRILAFLNRKGVKPVFLTQEPLFDIGSAFCLP